MAGSRPNERNVQGSEVPGQGTRDGRVASRSAADRDYPVGESRARVAYLNPTNAVISADDDRSYVEAVSAVLQDPRALQALRQGCLRAAPHFTVEAMAARFVAGICTALETAGGSARRDR